MKMNEEIKFVSCHLTDDIIEKPKEKTNFDGCLLLLFLTFFSDDSISKKERNCCTYACGPLSIGHCALDCHRHWRVRKTDIGELIHGGRLDGHSWRAGGRQRTH